MVKRIILFSKKPLLAQVQRESWNWEASLWHRTLSFRQMAAYRVGKHLSNRGIVNKIKNSKKKKTKKLDTKKTSQSKTGYRSKQRVLKRGRKQISDKYLHVQYL